MIRYLLRRIGYGFLILIGVNLLTFMLFFTVNTPDDMARLNIGGKRDGRSDPELERRARLRQAAPWNERAEGSDKLTDNDFLAAQCTADGRRSRSIGRGTRHCL